LKSAVVLPRPEKRLAPGIRTQEIAVTLHPLLSASPVIQAHAFAALAALAIGTGQLLATKGTLTHRTVGIIWCVVMLFVAASSLFIHEFHVIGNYSPIHILSFVVLVTVPRAFLAARRGDIQKHRRIMQSLFWLALIGAGLFTLWPGRIMHAVVFGS
jgi:uncharacterized membrane protein